MVCEHPRLVVSIEGRGDPLGPPRPFALIICRVAHAPRDREPTVGPYFSGRVILQVDGMAVSAASMRVTVLVPMPVFSESYLTLPSPALA